MEKSFCDIFVQLAGDSKASEAKRIVKVLESHGICSMKELMSVSPEHLIHLKGIGMRYLHVIEVVRTKERCKQEKLMKDYKKAKKVTMRDFKYYAQKVGCTYLEACQFERILKKNGIRDMGMIMSTPHTEVAQFKGIGAIRLQRYIQIKSLAGQDMKV